MLTYAVPLKLSIPILANTFDVTELQQQYHTKIIIAEAINPEIINFFNSLSVRISAAEAFWSPPGFCGRAHVDSAGGDYVKLNWILSGTDSQMLWYSVADSANNAAEVTAIGTSTVAYTPEQVTLQYQTKLHSPSIVQVGVPHHIVNGNSARLCISVIIKQQGQRSTMAQARTIFSDYICEP